MQEHSTVLTSYTSLLSNQTRGYEDTFRSARNIMFELGECSCEPITKQSVMAMVDNDAYTDSIANNPFNFKHFSASQVAICLNREMPASPLKLSFADGQYIHGYKNLFATTGRIDMDNGLNVMGADYKSNYCIFGFKKSLSLSWEASKTGKNDNFASEYRV